MLDRIAAFLRPMEQFCRPPRGPFDPSADWKMEYDQYSVPFAALLQAKRPQGGLRLARQAMPDGSIRLTADSRRNGLSGYFYFVHAEFQCLDNELCSPARWRAESKMALAPADPPYLLSGAAIDGWIEDGVMHAAKGAVESRVPISSGWSAKWCLFAAVGRLAPDPRTELRFDMIDETDAVLPGQRLRYRGAAALAFADGSQAECRVFEHTGPGTLPIHYVVDPAGRLLLWASGVECFALRGASGLATGG